MNTEEENKVLRDALSRILWVKDCGIDGPNEKGEYVNWPIEERDAMYDIAKETLEKLS